MQQRTRRQFGGGYLAGLVILAVTAASCAPTVVSGYIPDRRGATRRVYANFETTREAVRSALGELGWEIEEEASPDLFEFRPRAGAGCLIVTRDRRSSWWAGERRERMNIYIDSVDDVSEVEVRIRRYRRGIVFRSLGYGDPRTVEQVFSLIQRGT